ncbi:hypothetical protein B0T16DRAFT_460697 [Cercophora newfieldiana]|uniref:Uncharacterized protein n=1 Tax=Cercophora newfieldiana TaxID=92897 RepID=A0AA39Y290_9PEZI|nr:hypothetical protein B0T16DRAFT_460697 [Cercophora newfieldiana]
MDSDIEEEEDDLDDEEGGDNSDDGEEEELEDADQAWRQVRDQVYELDGKQDFLAEDEPTTLKEWLERARSVKEVELQMTYFSDQLLRLHDPSEAWEDTDPESESNRQSPTTSDPVLAPEPEIPPVPLFQNVGESQFYVDTVTMVRALALMGALCLGVKMWRVWGVRQNT